MKKMKVIVLKNTWIYKFIMAVISEKVIIVPHWFFPASCLGPFIVIRERDYNQSVLNHEYIHYLQQKEMLFVGAYFMYMFEFICKLIVYANFKDLKNWYKNAYINISFEREAHAMQPMLGYCGNRKRFAHFKCVYMKNGLKFRGK